MKNDLTKYTVFALLAFIIGLLYWACSEDANPLPSKAHTKDWANPTSENFHGKKVAEVGYDYCKSCHGDDFEGGESDVSCYKCHDNFPHPAEWMVISSDMFHGKYLNVGTGKVEDCQNCHGEDYKGGSSDVSCYSCHKTYPHPEGWMSQDKEEFHGKYLNSGMGEATDCQGCHGVDYQGGSSGVSCITCHNSYPHQEGWTTPASDQFHGTFIKKNEWNMTSCQGCHGDDFAGGSSNVSCYTCHATFPHKSGWVTPGNEQFHGTYISSDTGEVEDCQSCHGEDYQGGSSGVSCTSCHASYPHPEDWSTPGNEQFHGKFVDDNGWNTTTCQGCHGTDYTGGTSNVSCYTCHSTFPHPAGWMTSGDSQFHGQVVIDNNWSAESCQSCHGADYTGGKSSVSCYACHSSFPHPAGWMTSSDDQFHGKAVSDNNWDTESCQGCHGVDYTGGKSNISCYTCHSTFPHPAGWMTSGDSQFHGQVVIDNNWNAESCQSCHGADYTGGTTNVSCYTCHSSFPHPEGWMSTGDSRFHGQAIIDDNWNTESCQGCHGVDYTGGKSNVSCYTCHSTFPHPTGWMIEDDAQFHGQVVINDNWNTLTCQGCHGDEYTGGTSHISCYTCHANFPHNSDWVNVSSTGFHGNYIRQASWSMNSCKSCHGDDYRGGTTNASCYTCHQGDAGPESCNVCHGNANHSYPPEDLNKNTATTALGVGAHQKHMEEFNACQLCHVVPATFDDPTHIDAPPAEVKSNLGWDRQTATCASSCHGADEVWNKF